MKFELRMLKQVEFYLNLKTVGEHIDQYDELYLMSTRWLRSASIDSTVKFAFLSVLWFNSIG